MNNAVLQLQPQLQLRVTRLDHLGIVAGVIKDLKLIENIDVRLQSEKKDMENITPGEAIAGMIINGMGFTSKPLSLTPQFFKNKALEELFRPGVDADDFNRHKLGRSMDKAYEYGNETLFYELASFACIKENVNQTFNSLDTTT